MARASKLSDLQRILLTTAAGRDDVSLLPTPAGVATPARVKRALVDLLKRGLVGEATVGEAARSWRSEGGRIYGLTVTPLGRDAVSALEGCAPSDVPVTPAPQPTTKIGHVTALLARDGGATLDEMIAGTGWLPHTTRAALTGLRKKGHAIIRAKRGELTCYHLAAVA